jgi:prophage regulatory protein
MTADNGVATVRVAWPANPFRRPDFIRGEEVTSVGKYLMGAGEIGERLGVSRQRVQQLIASPNFPDPYEELQMGKIWLIEDVEAWIRDHRKKLVDG